MHAHICCTKYSTCIPKMLTVQIHKKDGRCDPVQYCTNHQTIHSAYLSKECSL